MMAQATPELFYAFVIRFAAYLKLKPFKVI
jgi:hypothetical protein